MGVGEVTAGEEEVGIKVEAGTKEPPEDGDREEDGTKVTFPLSLAFLIPGFPVLFYT